MSLNRICDKAFKLFGRSNYFVSARNMTYASVGITDEQFAILKRKEMVSDLLRETQRVNKTFHKQLPVGITNEIQDYFHALPLSLCPIEDLCPLLYDMGSIPYNTLQENKVRVTKDFKSLVFLIMKDNGVGVHKLPRS